MKFCRAGIIFALLLLMAAAPSTAPNDLEDLKQKALSEDLGVSKVALKALVAKGASARPMVREVVKELLLRDKARVMGNAAVLADVQKYQELDERVAAQRNMARENIS